VRSKEAALLIFIEIVTTSKKNRMTSDYMQNAFWEQAL
jgi:hypothetical protein